MKLTYVLAILAAAISTSAMAKDLKQDKKATSNAATVKATVMNDAEMDKVTAGLSVGISNPGRADVFREVPTSSGRVGTVRVCINCD